MDSSTRPLIQVSTDFTEISDFAIEHAVVIARLFRANLLIVHVIDKYSKKLCKSENKPANYIEDKLADLAAKVKNKYGIEAHTVLRTGNVIKEITKSAEEHDAILHVMGTHGKTGMQHIVGSFTLKVIKYSTVPVLVIQSEPGKTKYEKIVFPLELHPSSKQKIKFAKLLNKHAGSCFEFFVDYQDDKSSCKRIKADLRQLSCIMENHGIQHNETYAKPGGLFLKKIEQFAEEQNADAIMVTSDPDKFSWNPFNSEDKILYNKAKIPVIVINAEYLSLLIGG